MRDVKDEDSRRQHGGYPDESRICGFIHGDSSTYKSCAKPLTAALISENNGLKAVNSF
jgi:hypothetical protein